MDVLIQLLYSGKSKKVQDRVPAKATEPDAI